MVISPGMTVDHYANLFSKNAPYIWNKINVRHIKNPPGYYGFHLPAVTMTAIALECMSYNPTVITPTAKNVAVSIDIMSKYGFPTYYVGRDLLEAIKHTHPPKDRTWESVKWPFPGVIFMLPTDMIIEPASGESVNFVSVVFNPKGIRYAKLVDIDFETPSDQVSIFWSVRNGIEIEDVTIHVSCPLETTPRWIVETSQTMRAEWEHNKNTRLKECDEQFSSYMTALASTLMLVWAARPSLVEEGERLTRKPLKSGVHSYSPNFIGRKYKIVRKEYKNNGTSLGHYTKIGFRSGYFWHGSDVNQEEEIWVDPYMARCKGWVHANKE